MSARGMSYVGRVIVTSYTVFVTSCTVTNEKYKISRIYARIYAEIDEKQRISDVLSLAYLVAEWGGAIHATSRGQHGCT